MASSYLGRMLRLPVPGQSALAPPRWLMRRPEAGDLAPGAGSARPAEAPRPRLPVARRPKPQAAVRREGTDEALAGPSAAAEDDVAERRPAAAWSTPPPRPAAVATPTAIAGPGPALRPAGVPRHAAQRTRNAAASGTPDAIRRATPDATAQTRPHAVPEGVDAGPAITPAAVDPVPAAAEGPARPAAASARHGRATASSHLPASRPAGASESGATNLGSTRVPTTGPATVQPAAPAPQAPPRAARGEREPGVRIGTIEVVVTPPPAAAPGPTASSPGRHTTARAAARLSRSFPSGFGLRQG